MKSRRDLVLEEMGLSPVWRLRTSAGTQLDGGVEAEAASGDEPAVVSRQQSRSASHESPATNHQSRISSHESPVTRHPPAVPAGDERRATIMAMDWAALKQCVAGCTDCPLHER